MEEVDMLNSLFSILLIAQAGWASEAVLFNTPPKPAAQRDSLNIRFVGQCSTPGWACQVCVQGSYAYVADYDGGLRIIEVSDPAAPVEIGSCDSVYDAMHVVVHGTYAYVASGAHGMHSVDVSDPRHDYLGPTTESGKIVRFDEPGQNSNRRVDVSPIQSHFAPISPNPRTGQLPRIPSVVLDNPVPIADSRIANRTKLVL